MKIRPENTHDLSWLRVTNAGLSVKGAIANLSAKTIFKLITILTESIEEGEKFKLQLTCVNVPFNVKNCETYRQELALPMMSQWYFKFDSI